MSESCGVRVTVGIVTKNRPDDLRKCLTSLALVADVLGEVIVVDDTSETDLSDAIAAAPASVSSKLRSIYQRHHEGYIVARNRIVREATTEFVLLMDDDAWLLDAESVPLALSVIARDDRVAAVACAMATPDGSPWDARTQPSSASYACY